MMVVSGQDEHGRDEQVGPCARLLEGCVGAGDSLLLCQKGLAFGLPPPTLVGVPLGLGGTGLSRTVVRLARQAVYAHAAVIVQPTLLSALPPHGLYYPLRFARLSASRGPADPSGCSKPQRVSKRSTS